MTSIDPVWATVAELSHAFGARTLSPVDAVDALLDRIAPPRTPRCTPSSPSTTAEARLAAEGADQAIRSGHRIGPLHGVPIALKDLVDLEGRVTTGGSKVWAERVSPVTATLAERAIAAGMIVLGKTHTVEFAMGSWGTNTHMGSPAQPVGPRGAPDARRLVQRLRRRGRRAGLAPVAIGTDTGGSVRIPAAWCGIVGLKVTAGRISTYGVLPLSLHPRHAGAAGALGRGRGAHLPPAQRARSARPADARVGAGRSAADPPPRRRRPPPRGDARRRAGGRRRGGARRLRRVDRRARRARRRDRPRRAAASLRATTPRPPAGSSASRATASSATWSTTRACPSIPHVRPRIQLGRGVSARDYLLALAAARGRTAARSRRRSPTSTRS